MLGNEENDYIIEFIKASNGVEKIYTNSYEEPDDFNSLNTHLDYTNGQNEIHEINFNNLVEIQVHNIIEKKQLPTVRNGHLNDLSPLKNKENKDYLAKKRRRIKKNESKNKIKFIIDKTREELVLLNTPANKPDEPNEQDEKKVIKLKKRKFYLTLKKLKEF